MPAQLFSLANLLAITGWVLLAAFPRRRWAALASQWLVPGLLAALYVTIVAFAWGRTPGGFSSLGAVAQLFENPWMLLAGWVHYLAFDLLIGNWIACDARERGIAHVGVLPLLLLTFMFGPAGWLSYLGVRALAARRTAARETAARETVERETAARRTAARPAGGAGEAGVRPAGAAGEAGAAGADSGAAALRDA